jgi:hypothetical protein
MVGKTAMKTKFAALLFTPRLVAEFEEPTTVAPVIQSLLRRLNDMQFQGNSKNSRDWAVRVNWHGKKSYYWSKPSPHL